jgi:hypothetical protein
MAHWTQTPEGKKKLSRSIKKAMRARRRQGSDMAQLAKLGAKARIEQLKAEINRLQKFLKA